MLCCLLGEIKWFCLCVAGVKILAESLPRRNSSLLKVQLGGLFLRDLATEGTIFPVLVFPNPVGEQTLNYCVRCVRMERVNVTKCNTAVSLGLCLIPKRGNELWRKISISWVYFCPPFLRITHRNLHCLLCVLAASTLQLHFGKRITYLNRLSFWSSQHCCLISNWSFS